MGSLSDVPDICHFLTDKTVCQLLRAHPNTADLLLDHHWLHLLTGPVPPHLAPLIDAIRALQLPRDPIPIHALQLPPPFVQGMSPKKAHEVHRMAAYVVSLLEGTKGSVWIVDVGAGQGYLTRALSYHLPHTPILAIDADEQQTLGAQRFEARVFRGKLKSGARRITHKILLINPDNLLQAVDEWVREEAQSVSSQIEPPSPPQILFVALHACGSLTIDVLRAYVAAVRQRRTTTAAEHLWTPAGVVAVGCCYNLMRDGDFPLSKAYRSFTPAPPTTSNFTNLSPTPSPPPSESNPCSPSRTLADLPPSAYHLASQIPSQWLDSTLQPTPSTKLALRKVTWRALVGRILDPTTGSGSGSGPGLGAGLVSYGHTDVPTRADSHGETDEGSAEDDTSKDRKKKKTSKKSEKASQSATVPARWTRRPETWDLEASASMSPSSSALATSTTTTATTTTTTTTPSTDSSNATDTLTPNPDPGPDPDPDPETSLGLTPTHLRLGKLPAPAYTSWGAFLRCVEGKLPGVRFAEELVSLRLEEEEDGEAHAEEDGEAHAQDDSETHAEKLEKTLRTLLRSLETLHTLRCLLGPVVESAILRDRVGWVKEELLPLPLEVEHGLGLGAVDEAAVVDADVDVEGIKVKLVNLFDQSTGSGRNVAIVVLPPDLIHDRLV